MEHLVREGFFEPPRSNTHARRRSDRLDSLLALLMKTFQPYAVFFKFFARRYKTW